MPGHPLRSALPRFAQKPVMPANCQGPALDPVPGALRSGVGFGRVYQRHRHNSALSARGVATCFEAGAEAGNPRIGYRTKVRKWPRLSDAELEAQLVEWTAKVTRAIDAQVQARTRRWDLWVQQAFEQDGAARVYRFSKGHQVPASLILKPEAEPEALMLQEVVQAKASPWVRLWTPELPEFQALRRLPVRDRALPGPLPSALQFRDLLKTHR